MNTDAHHSQESPPQHHQPPNAISVRTGVAETFDKFKNYPVEQLAQFVTQQASEGLSLSPNQMQLLSDASPDLHALIDEQGHILNKMAKIPGKATSQLTHLQTYASISYVQKKQQKTAPLSPATAAHPARAIDFSEANCRTHDEKPTATACQKPKKIRPDWNTIPKQTHQTQKQAEAHIQNHFQSMRVSKTLEKGKHKFPLRSRNAGAVSEITYHCLLPSNTRGGCRALLTVLPGKTWLQVLVSDGCHCSQTTTRRPGLDPMVKEIATKQINRYGISAQPKTIARLAIAELTATGSGASPGAGTLDLSHLADSHEKRKQLSKQISNLTKKKLCATVIIIGFSMLVIL